MRKRVSWFSATALATAYSLAGCGGGSSTLTPSPPAPAHGALAVTATPVALGAGNTLAIGIDEAETLSVPASGGPATLTTTCKGTSISYVGSPGTSIVITGHIAGTCSVTLTTSTAATTIELTIANAGPSPSPSPAQVPVLSPASLTFTSNGVSQSLTATETGYAGQLTESDTCAGIASVSPASGPGPSAVFSVTAVAAGSCTVTIADASGRSGAALISVSTLGVVVQSKRS